MMDSVLSMRMYSVEATFKVISWCFFLYPVETRGLPIGPSACWPLVHYVVIVRNKPNRRLHSCEMRQDFLNIEFCEVLLLIYQITQGTIRQFVNFILDLRIINIKFNRNVIEYFLE